jgi:hypothetical protein
MHASPPFSFTGMDLGNSSALAQEDDYANQLVEVTPKIRAECSRQFRQKQLVSNFMQLIY